ncbi:MAG: HlyD family efflux transporter periplasmic adaptor subunit [Snowella sp.]|nr:HlyD family efflux transporter periplasmic adaptor subunit [Snowella sp.]
MTNHLSSTENNPHNAQNGRSETNGNGSLAPIKGGASPVKSPNYPAPSLFSGSEQGIILRQSSNLSRAIIWSIIGVTALSVVWASFATMEEVIPATGQLKPQDTLKEIQAPVNGVVKEVLVKDNEQVKKGQTLVIMDSAATVADLKSAQNIRQKLLQENQFYRTLLKQELSESQLEMAMMQLKLPWEVAALAKNRTALIQENALFSALLGNGGNVEKLSSEQMARLRMARFELNSRVTAADMEIQQLQKQLLQAQVQLESAQRQLVDDQKIFADLKVRNDKAVLEAEKSLKIEERILGSVQPLLEEGALAKLQIEKQQQAVNDRYQRIIEQKVNGSVEYDKQRQQIQTRSAEINRLEQEKKRLDNLIEQARAKLVNTSAITEKEIYDRMADNTKKIADIDSQLTKIIVENEKKINELNSQISRSQVTLKYQEIKSPVNGTVFDLKATPGYVTPPTQTVPLLKIVPTDSLIAQVDITNKDIGFVRQGMKADVRIDSFPYSEFGDIKGKVILVGSDALPPDETYKFYRFPTQIQLDHQYLKTADRQIPLQSGMSVTANIKVREKRTVMSLFTELFTKKIESLETVR